MSEDTLKPMIYSIADALEIDLIRRGNHLEGKRKVVMAVFEGYSPTVVTNVIDSIIDDHNGVIAVCVQIWGNLNVLCVNDKQAQNLTLFVYDRSKIKKGSSPFDTFWSRQKTYRFLGPCIKGIYHRSVFDTVWTLMEDGPSKLRIYNDMREKGMTANSSYMAMWGDT